MSHFVLPALLLSTAALAQAADGGAATGVLTRPPALTKQVDARFPAEALDAGVAGTVQMEIDIGPDGKVMEARVTQGAGHGFDEAALEAVRQFEFSPAEVDGQPAAVRIAYTYQFFFRAEVESPTDAGQLVNFSGTLLERGTRKPVAGATVTVGPEGDSREAVSDEQGRFELAGVPLGTQPVTVSASDYLRYQATEEFKAHERTLVTYYVRRRQYSTYETVVRTQHERKEVAQVALKQEEVRLIPGTQGDAFKVIQNLPGVARSPFSIGLLIVRGGKPWDTKTYVDDALVPQLFHFGGLFATFNSNLLEDISFQPGNFGVERGRNIGGIVSATTRTPSKDLLHGYVDVNLIDASALAEGPVGGDWSVAAGVRRSYLDATLPLGIKLFYPQANLSFTVAPRYWDYQLKAEHRAQGSRDKLAVMVFGSSDEISVLLPNPAFDPEGRNTVSTAILYNRLAVQYEKRLGPRSRLLLHNMVGYDQTGFAGGTDLYAKVTYTPILGRESLQLEVPELALALSTGLDFYAVPYRYSVQRPPNFKLNQIPDPFISRQLVREDSSVVGLEPALFVEGVWKPLSGLKVVAGVRGDYESQMKKGWVDPRLASFYELVPDWTTLKAAVGLFHQPPDYRQGYLSPTFGNPDLLPEGAIHYSVGVEQKLTDAIGVNLDLYYKDLFHQVRPTLGTFDASSDGPQLAYDSGGVGRSYGAEVLLRHQLTRNFFGWIAYSLSRSERVYPTNGKWGLHPLDQPHNLIALASYKLPLDFIVGARVRYASGALDTPYTGAIYDVNGNYYFPLPGALFSKRLPDFFQLDVRVDKRFVFERYMIALYLDVQNATNRANVESVLYNYDYTQQAYLTGLPILPSLGLRGEW